MAMSRNSDNWGATASISEAEVALVWENFVRTRTDALRDRLIEHYMPLVYQTAERMAQRLPGHIDVNDLISAGTVGLIDAISRFEPEREIKFSTYCCTRIQGSIIDELRRVDWAPRQVRNWTNKLSRTRDELESELGRKPTEEEIAGRMNLTPEEFEALMKETQVKSMVSLDRKWDEDDDHELGQVEMIADTRAADPLSVLARDELKKILLRGLAEKEKLVVTMYYYDHLSLKEIGATLGLSESRVCQIHAQTLDFLREKLRQRKIHSVHDF